MIEQLGDLLRLSLESVRQQQVCLSKELEFVSRTFRPLLEARLGQPL
jgi:hypothetical protein